MNILIKCSNFGKQNIPSVALVFVTIICSSFFAYSKFSELIL